MVSILGKKIRPAAVAKDLGVILDSDLTYNDHIASTVLYGTPRPD